MNQMEIKINFDASILSNVEALNVFLKTLSKDQQQKESVKEIPVFSPEVIKPTTAKKTAKKETPDVPEKEIEQETQNNDEDSNDPKITLDLIRPLLQTKVQLNRDAIKEKLSELGANNATSLEEQHYQTFYKFLSDL
jgi:hypothetical protein